MPGQPHHDYKLTVDDADRMARAIRPIIMESIDGSTGRKLDAQTAEIRGIVGIHEKNVLAMLDRHEESDNAQFKEVKAEQLRSNASISKLNQKQAYISGGIAVLVFIAPMVWDFIKWKSGMGK